MTKGGLNLIFLSRTHKRLRLLTPTLPRARVRA